ncbi:GtrA family protein [Arenibaculum pallidiluteum]|uniref:GtrA family protein n=1 Tax=Arenibaculum pallidiluteum TaxID=2812559 RepID=UPI001A96ADC6|nr:GtrA family protein [Arenibaculum pallidiluteum]
MTSAPSTPVGIAARYVAFAIIATAINLASQWATLALYGGPLALGAAMAVGTLAGLVVKYLLDKRWIFDDRSTGAGAHARRFSLYTAMGLVTTAVFWGTELLFHALFGEGWALPGGAVGLAIGYWLKYRLDRRFVFDPAPRPAELCPPGGP